LACGVSACWGEGESCPFASCLNSNCSTQRLLRMNAMHTSPHRKPLERWAPMTDKKFSLANDLSFLSVRVFKPRFFKPRVLLNHILQIPVAAYEMQSRPTNRYTRGLAGKVHHDPLETFARFCSSNPKRSLRRKCDFRNTCHCFPVSLLRDRCDQEDQMQ